MLKGIKRGPCSINSAMISILNTPAACMWPEATSLGPGLLGGLSQSLLFQEQTFYFRRHKPTAWAEPQAREGGGTRGTPEPRQPQTMAGH